MKWPFKLKQRDDAPFLSPLSQQRSFRESLGQRLPSATAPIVFMVVGGLTLVVAIAGMLGSPDTDPTATAAESPVEPALAAPAAPPAVAAVPAVSFASELEAARIPEAAVTAAGETDPDPARTASILSAIPSQHALQPEVEIAETEAEIAALESVQRTQVEEDIGVPAAPATASLAADSDLHNATTTGHVNMRAGPNDEAEVLAIIPASTRIQVEAGCSWCAVAYDGRSGYIYRSFISYE